MWRLFLILIAATQIAALPLKIEPPTVEIGMPLTVSITLPNLSSELVGFPDLGFFALLEPPVRNGNQFTFTLLPLRPGSQRIPAFAFRSDQRLESTDSIDITVEAPAILATAHPLKPFPDSTSPDGIFTRVVYLIAGLGGVVLLLSTTSRFRRSKTIQPPVSLDDQFAQLARAAKHARNHNDPDWNSFCQRLERIRFAPVSRNTVQLAELTAEFARLKGERL
jgi:hypothetical protein